MEKDTWRRVSFSFLWEVRLGGWKSYLIYAYDKY